MDRQASVLVVDDNDINRDLLTRQLERRNYSVAIAAGGEQALSLVGQKKFDLVLLDIMMPGINGIETLTIMRRDHSQSELPVIMVTAKHESTDIVEALSLGANDYVVKPIDFQVLYARVEAQLARKRAEEALREFNQALEKKVEERTAQYQEALLSLQNEVVEREKAEQTTRLAENQLVEITKNLPGVIFRKVRQLDGNVYCHFVSAGACELIGPNKDEAAKGGLLSLQAIHADDQEKLETAINISAEELSPIDIEYRIVPDTGKFKWIHCSAYPQRLPSGEISWDGLLLDVSDRKILESQLAQAQKLESVGQLAAGIAHEINTPTQYVGDNIRFLQEAFDDLQKVTKIYARLFTAAREGNVGAALISEVDEVLENTDLAYLNDEVPRAITQALDGVNRVAVIVGAMKHFSHPGGDDKEAADINQIIENTVTVTQNEWKYVARVETNLAEDLPLVLCHRDQLSQVFLNLIVNAAHAIRDAPVNRSDNQGTISIATRKVGDEVEIQVIDTGHGVPESLITKIFDPFFTTKEVGKGTGQGLAIARSIVVDKHGGEMDIESEPGNGAAFTIRLPLGEGSSTGKHVPA